MPQVFFTQFEAQARLGRKVRVMVNTLYDIRQGSTGTVIGMALLDSTQKGYGVVIKWNLESPALGIIKTVFTKSEYAQYLTEEEPESPPKITYD